jgi:hypothetical protein
MNKVNTAIREMAYAIERERVGSALCWTPEQFHTWCHSDPAGSRSFKKSIRIARVAYKSLDKMGLIK